MSHRTIKRIIRPMLGLKSFHSARITRVGIELARTIKEGQTIAAGRKDLSAAKQFYSLAV